MRLSATRHIARTDIECAKMITRAQQLRDIASECQSLAECFEDAGARKQMLDVADQIERLARLRECLSDEVRQPGLIEEISEPTHKSLMKLCTYWLRQQRPRIEPPRLAVQLEKMIALHPNTALVDVVGDPPRFHFRHFGTRVAEVYGENLTGKFLDEIDLGSGPVKTDLTNLYTKMVREGRPQIVRVRLTKRDGRPVKYERIAFPLSEDGKAVNMFLFAYAFEREFFDALKLQTWC